MEETSINILIKSIPKVNLFVNELQEFKYINDVNIHDNLVNIFSNLTTHYNKYFLTSYSTRTTPLERHVKFYFRQNTISENGWICPQTIFIFEEYFLYDTYLEQYFRKYKKHEVLNLYRTETDNFYNYFMTIKKQVELKLIDMVADCDICFQANKKTYEKNMFSCNHNTFCRDCINKVTTCPLCRATKK